MILTHFARRGQIESLKKEFTKPNEEGNICYPLWIDLMMAHSLSDRQLQELREKQEQKKLDRIASMVFPPGFLQ